MLMKLDGIARTWDGMKVRMYFKVGDDGRNPAWVDMTPRDVQVLIEALAYVLKRVKLEAWRPATENGPPVA